MTSLLYIQLLTSFIVGGSAIALLSLLAEKVDKKVAGIITSLPLTVVISFIFVAWSTSPKTIGMIAPATLATESSNMIFAIVYMYLAKIKTTRFVSIILSLFGGLTAWFILSVPLAKYKFTNLPLGIIFTVLAIALAYYLFAIKNREKPPAELLTYTTSQKIGRAVIAGLVISLTIFLSKILNPFWGGIFSGFPAGYTSTFLILHWYYGSNMLFKIARALPVGGLLYSIYILACHWTFPAYGIFGGTIFAYLVYLLFLFIYLKISKRT